MSWSYLLESDNLTREQLRKYNVSELQGILTQLNLASNGKKHELVERLFQFWQSIQTPAPGNPKPAEHVTPTSSVKFAPPPIANITEFRAKIEIFGPIVMMLFDPSENSFYVTFRSQESAESLMDGLKEIGGEEQIFIPDSEVEKHAKQMQLLAENLQPHNAIQKTFRKTNFEPRIFWRPNIDADD
ncbi:SAP domain containing protein [Tritrichomonas foetus]|uniref:SAP domain containing protein n=1 Tax=Tritrichomonas foetus TaxID=1144522 RepID=A0A1J4KMP2_9EUKA|nr:SAP domain containing protein [Tritrichomonas foetus]|eukprot:OHT11068.1 SAP domain containing protein [Tritrichomonas foetus]